MSTTAIGRAAEQAAAAYLTKRGFRIATANWRTRWCEIDLVAIKNDVTYFVEAKYRTNLAWGSGLEYITKTKLRHMHIAAQFWAASHRTGDYCVAAIELTGQPPRVTQWVPDVS